MFAIALDALPELAPDAPELELELELRAPDAFELEPDAPLKLDVAKKEEGVMRVEFGVHLPQYFAAGVSTLVIEIATIADGEVLRRFTGDRVCFTSLDVYGAFDEDQARALTDERFRVTSTVRWGIGSLPAASSALLVDLLSLLSLRRQCWPANVLHVDFGQSPKDSDAATFKLLLRGRGLRFERVVVHLDDAHAQPARRVMLAAIKRFVCAVATKSVTVIVGHSSRARVASFEAPFDVADMRVPV